MLPMLRPGTSLTWDLLWQSSLFLAIGLGTSTLLRRHPARAHRALILSMVAALVTPIVAQAVRMGGWGVLSSTTAVVRIETAASPEDDLVRTPIVPLSQRVSPERRSIVPNAVRPAPSTGLPTASAADPPATVRSPGPGPVSWRETAMGAWAILCSLAVLRLAASFFRGTRIVRTATPVDDMRLSQAASRAASRLGLRFEPEIRTSRAIRCPSVWCWGRRPLLLIPGRNVETASIDWVAVFCHELAHWRRLDHISALGGQLLVCVLPWNPLAWWTKSRMAQLAELACDDWVLASGLEGAGYAASLLELMPQRGGVAALAAVSSRKGLVGRLKHILGDRRSDPRIGPGWAILTGASMLVAASALALAQTRPASSPSRDGDSPPRGTSEPSSSTPGKPDPLTHTTRGRVLGPDGMPARGATVIWVGTRKPSVPYVALPRDDETRMNPPIATLARAKADAQGAFVLTARFDPEELVRFNGIESKLVAMAPGAGLFAKDLGPNESLTEVDIQLPRETVIHGRLLTPGGQPAPGVRVLLSAVNDDTKNEGMYVGLQEHDDKLLPYWPKPLRTDAGGRFTLEGVPQGTYATLSFWHPDYAVDEVTVNARLDGVISAGLKGFEIVPVKPDFTHTLEPARPVQGRVTDKASGKPLAGMRIEMIPMRRHGGMPFTTRTDADGRYRVSGHSTDGTYFTTVYPPANSGYLGASDQHQGWPAGAKSLEVNFGLERGRLVSGRVLNHATRQPIPGAAVVYEAGANNPNNTGSLDLRNTVLTDKDGKFTITVLPGQGLLAVETPDEGYIRTPLKGSTYGRTVYPQGHVSIDVPKDGAPPDAEIAVRKGVTLKAKVIGPDGQLVRDVTAMYPGIDAKLIDVWDHGQNFADGMFRIQGADPEKTYRVYFIKPEQRLGAVAELKYDPRSPEPLQVKLQPTATVRGKVVHPTGAAAQGSQVMPMLMTSGERKELSRTELFDRDRVQFYSNVLGQRNFFLLDREIGSQGEFSFESMIPGAWFYVQATSAGRVARVPTPVLKPGEVCDLGSITLKEERP